MSSTTVLDHDLCTRLASLVETLTKNGGKQLDEKIIKQIKSICKTDDSYVEHLFHLVLTEMQREHSEVRYITLLITDELFNRSHKFRTLLLSDFQNFLELTAETDPDYPLPPPKAAAKDLKLKALQCVHEWHKKFHTGYKLLVIGYNFLKECKLVNFENMETLSVAQRRQLENSQHRKEVALRNRVDKATSEMDDMLPEINTTLIQMKNCFKLLVPNSEDIFESNDFESSNKDSETNCGESRVDGLRSHGLLSHSSCNIPIEVDPVGSMCVHKNDDTETVINNLKELHQEVKQRFMSSIAKWMLVFTQGGCQAKLKELIDLKNSLENACKNYNDLRICAEPKACLSTHGDNEDDDSDFEEVSEKPDLELIIPQHRRQEYGLEPATDKLVSATPTPRLWNVKSKGKDEEKDPTTIAANVEARTRKIVKRKEDFNLNQPSTSSGAVSSRKADLLSKAPKLPYDIDLYHWEEEKLEIPTVVKFDSLHKFWTPNENELSERQIEEGTAALRRRFIDYSGNFTPVRWTCRAPLQSGKLCPRQDRVKCPFHGKVIPRDAIGNPTQSSVPLDQPSTSKEEVPDWQDPSLLRDIEAATGVNLKMPPKRKKKGQKAKSDKKSVKKNAKLTNLKVYKNTTRSRLEKKVLNKDTVKRVSAALDTLDRKKFADKFGHQWNYSFSN